MDKRSRIADWENWIGRHLRLRDLHVFATVAKEGSMARAAQRLGITQPADFQRSLPIWNSRSKSDCSTAAGAESNSPPCVSALLRHGNAAFDELKQSVMDIDFLSDPTSGELRIGCPEAIADANLPPILLDFSRRYPRVSLTVIEAPAPMRNLMALYDRTCRTLSWYEWKRPRPIIHWATMPTVEELFEDRVVAAVNKTSRLGTSP